MKISTMGATALALALVGLTPALAANAATEYQPERTFTLIAWEMPEWINSTTASWPQSYETSIVQTAPDLDALDTSLPCGSQFQIDANYTGPVVASLIAGGVLYGPGNPPEALIPGGWDVAYKLIKTPDCVPEPVVEQHEESYCASETEYVAHTWTTTDGVVSGEASSLRILDRPEAIDLGCYVPPVVEPVVELPTIEPPVEVAQQSSTESVEMLAETGADLIDLLIVTVSALFCGAALVFASIARRR